MNYTTGQRFTAKIQGMPVEGKIYVVTQNEFFLCQNKFKGQTAPNKLGYDFSWFCDPCNLPSFITELQILPDTSFDKDNCKDPTEPKKGDAVEVSDDNKDWLNPEYYTGGQTKAGHFITETKNGNLDRWKHIRLAKSPEQVKQKAVKNPIDNVTVENLSAALKYFGYQTDPKMLDLIIDLVELLENRGSDTTINELVTLELERMGALTA